MSQAGYRRRLALGHKVVYAWACGTLVPNGPLCRGAFVTFDGPIERADLAVLFSGGLFVDLDAPAPPR